MKISIQEIAVIVNGIIVGNTEAILLRPAKIETAEAGAITFLANPKYEKYVYTSLATAILVPKDFIPRFSYTATLIKVENVYGSIAKVLKLFEPARATVQGISPTTSIHTTAKLGKDCAIGDFTVIQEGAIIGDGCIIYPQVYIGAGTVVGDHCIIYPGVKIYHDCQIGAACILHSNAVIGSDGFGFALQADGSFDKIPQVGTVILEEAVEIGANTVIDRATMGATIIKKGTKLDNLIQIGHNVEVGAHTVISAQAGIAGSTTIGKHCQIGGQAGFVGHIEIADQVGVQAQSGVAASITEKGKKVFGYPAIGYRDYLKSYTLFKQLPKLEKRIRDLEKQIKEKS